MKQIILFDGVCHFCNWNVQFIIRRDPHAKFLFASLQSETGQRLLQRHHISKEEYSIVLVKDNRYYTQSTAVLHIARHLHRLYPMLYICIAMPRPLRDVFYRFIAKNRYKWFGKEDQCRIPSAEDKTRFLS